MIASDPVCSTSETSVCGAQTMHVNATDEAVLMHLRKRKWRHCCTNSQDVRRAQRSESEKKKQLFHFTNVCVCTEGSAYEESVCNEGSICGSDSFYRQTEGLKMDFTRKSHTLEQPSVLIIEKLQIKY